MSYHRDRPPTRQLAKVRRDPPAMPKTSDPGELLRVLVNTRNRPSGPLAVMARRRLRQQGIIVTLVRPMSEGGRP